MALTHVYCIYALFCLPACALDLPLLALSPRSLETSISQAQQLTISYANESTTLQAALQADPEALRLAAWTPGETVLKILWDGRTLQQTRAPWLPKSVRGEQILSDVQMILWPIPAIAASLPPDCQLVGQSPWRLLYCHGQLAVSILYEGQPPQMRLARLHHLRLGYTLALAAVPL